MKCIIYSVEVFKYDVDDCRSMGSAYRIKAESTYRKDQDFEYYITAHHRARNVSDAIQGIIVNYINRFALRTEMI